MKKKVFIYKIIKATAGGLHSICESNVGLIRKPNNNISLYKEEDIIEKVPISINKEQVKKNLFFIFLEKIKKVLLKVIHSLGG